MNAFTLGIRIARALAMGAIALAAFYAISLLLFAVLGLAPSSPNWLFVPVLGGVLAIAGAGAGVQSFDFSTWGHRLAGILSGAASGAVLGFLAAGQLSGQQGRWAVAGAVAGSVLLGTVAGWAFGSSRAKSSRSNYLGGWRGFWRAAIALVGSLCGYGAAFGLGAWALAALGTGRWGLAVLLGGLAGLYLWLTRRGLGWVYGQWKMF